MILFYLANTPILLVLPPTTKLTISDLAEIISA